MMSYVFGVLFLSSLFVFGDCDCITPNFQVTQKISNEGFHREINWLIELLKPSIKDWDFDCKVVLRQDIPHGLYVNPDEIMDLNNTSHYSLRVVGKVDIEAPAHEATDHKVLIYLNNTKLLKQSIDLPIHLRYQRSQITGGYGKVNLQKPSLLIWCPQTLNRICQPGLKVDAFCEHFGPNRCIYKNITYEALFDNADLFVPIGDLDDYPIVSIVTLLLGCAGSIYILSVLSLTRL